MVNNLILEINIPIKFKFNNLRNTYYSEYILNFIPYIDNIVIQNFVTIKFNKYLNYTN